jgi:hypothetical protein
MKITIENIETDKRTTIETTHETINKDVSKVLGVEVECLDQWRDTIYFWKKGEDCNNNDATAFAEKEKDKTIRLASGVEFKESEFADYQFEEECEHE